MWLASLFPAQLAAYLRVLSGPRMQLGIIFAHATSENMHRSTKLQFEPWKQTVTQANFPLKQTTTSLVIVVMFRNSLHAFK